jgi:phosphatidylcholine synthase
MKTGDNFFRGFPALWNIIAFYLFMLQPGQLMGIIVVGLFSALTFAPIYFVHPLRANSYQPWCAAAAVLWGTGSLALLSPSWSPAWLHIWLALSLAGAGALLWIGAVRTLRGPRATER